MLTLTFKGLTLRNFISTGAVTQSVDLSANGLTLVLGQLIDTNGQVARNGAGKSTILHAISYALFGQALSKIKVDNMINDINLKNMLVTLNFEIGKDQYLIERGRKPTVLRFYKNGEELKHDEDSNDAKGENADTQRDINNIIGMDHTMFCHTVALNTQTIPFLKEGAGKQREIIEKLLGVTQISDRAKVLSKKITLTKDEIKTHEATVNATIETNKRIQEALDQANSKSALWVQNHSNNITQVGQLLSVLADIDIDKELADIERGKSFDNDKRALEANVQQTRRELELLEREARTAANELDALKRKAEAFDPDGKIAALKRSLDTIDYDNGVISKKNDAAKAAREALVEKIANKTKELENVDGTECTTCGQSLDGTHHIDAIRSRVEAELAKLTQTNEELGVEIHAFNNELTMKQAGRRSVEKEITALTATLEAEQTERKTLFEAATSNAKKDDAAQTALNETLRGFTDSLSKLGSRPTSKYSTEAEVYQIKQDRAALEAELTRLEKETNPHLDQITAFQNTIKEVDYTALNAAVDLLKHQEFMQKLLINKDSFIRKKIIDQNLSTLNDRMAHYLEKLVSSFQVKLNSDLSIDIIKLGRDYDFEQLSKGESNRVVMAVSWAMRDLWESLNLSINLMFVDELLDNGLDTTGAEDALKILKGMARDPKSNKNIFLVSHKDELRGRIDRTLLVSKDDGFSRFQFDEF